MARARKAKSPSPAKDDGQTVATYFLAKKSGLFRPGAAVILANVIPPQNSNKLVNRKGTRK